MSPDPLDLKRWLGEIEQKSVLAPGGAKIRTDDGKVDVFNGLDCFQLHDDLVGDKEIGLVSSDFNIPVEYRELRLAMELDSPQSELNLKCLLVNALEEAWAQSGVHLNGGSDNLLSQLLIFE